MNARKIIIIVFCVLMVGQGGAMTPSDDDLVKLNRLLYKGLCVASHASSVGIVGTTGVCGPRPYMEDTHVDYNPDNFFACYGVFDGHGGAYVAQKLAKELPQKMNELVKDNKTDIPAALTKACIDFNVKINADYNDAVALFEQDIEKAEGVSRDFANRYATFKQTPGSTAALLVMINKELYFCNIGDSKIVGYNNNGKVALESRMHKASDPVEVARIRKFGGLFRCFYDREKGRIVYVENALAMSRAFGNAFLKKWIICEPDVIRVTQEHALDCVVIASDGFWDVVTSEIAYSYINNYCFLHNIKREEITPENSREIAHYLVKIALLNGSSDNIMVKVIFLKS